MRAQGQPYGPGSKTGRFDVKGNEWFACDPYPTWFRWEDEELILPPAKHYWADECIKGLPAVTPKIAAMFNAGEYNEHNAMMLFHDGWRPTYLYHADPFCKHESDGRWSGIGCKHCNGWFCL